MAKWKNLLKILKIVLLLVLTISIILVGVLCLLILLELSKKERIAEQPTELTTRKTIFVTKANVSTVSPSTSNTYTPKTTTTDKPSTTTLAATTTKATKSEPVNLNTLYDPCDNFYDYVCGNYPKKRLTSFEMIEFENLAIQAEQLRKDVYRDEEMAGPLMQTAWFYDRCLQMDWTKAKASGTIVLESLATFRQATRLSFPMVDDSQGDVDYKFLDPDQLAVALGYLTGVFNEDTFISMFIDTNWKPEKPTDPPYLLFIDQNSLSLPKTYFDPTIWPLSQSAIESRVSDVIGELMGLLGVTVARHRFEKDVKDLVEFEWQLARYFSTDVNGRKQNLRSYNLMTITEVQQKYPFLNWARYLKMATVRAPTLVQRLINKSNFMFVMMEPRMISRLDTMLHEGNWYNVKARTVLNYLMYRLVEGKRRMLPNQKNPWLKEENRRPLIGQPGWFKITFDIDLKQNPEQFKTTSGEPISLQEFKCVYLTVRRLPYLNARIFVDALYPGDRGEGLRKVARPLLRSVLNAFQDMLGGSPWMSKISKAQAHSKIDSLVENVAFPDFVVDNESLASYYRQLMIAKTDDYLTMERKITDFNIRKAFGYLLAKKVDRHDWSGSSSVTNAWYQPKLNSITFPAAILRTPIFNENGPNSVNFGAIGSIVGHELAHAFDGQGVQWNSRGHLKTWMDYRSRPGFDRMQQCVLNEYSHFCPLDGDFYYPNCVNGQRTLDENIADNGGLHAAWGAYRAHVAIYGSDPHLNGPVLSQLTHDQLFFVGFAHIWCEAPLFHGDTFLDLLLDSHSPSKYRVNGAVQNHPAFRSAFNCPSHSKYVLEKHCNIWKLDNN